MNKAFQLKDSGVAMSGLVTGLENVRGMTFFPLVFVVFPVTVPLNSLDNIKHDLAESTNEQ